MYKRQVSRSGEDNYQNLERNYDAQMIVNTTPVGMYPNNGKAPLDLTPFRQCEAVVDIIYNPARTKLLLDAERLGIPCINGLPMLVAQAKRACEIFTEAEIAEERIDEITAQIERQTKNCLLYTSCSGDRHVHCGGSCSQTRALQRTMRAGNRADGYQVSFACTDGIYGRSTLPGGIVG